mmetsp:Transcript_47674/g.136132  ORF Transcript_47674/g.136132 Transcript_47674/m.136132 type:complete len:254 (+) Transcript_47674:176-937(+)
MMSCSPSACQTKAPSTGRIHSLRGTRTTASLATGRLSTGPQGAASGGRGPRARGQTRTSASRTSTTALPSRPWPRPRPCSSGTCSSSRLRPASCRRRGSRFCRGSPCRTFGRWPGSWPASPRRSSRPTSGSGPSRTSRRGWTRSLPPELKRRPRGGCSRPGRGSWSRPGGRPSGRGGEPRLRTGGGGRPSRGRRRAARRRAGSAAARRRTKRRTRTATSMPRRRRSLRERKRNRLRRCSLTRRSPLGSGLLAS